MEKRKGFYILLKDLGNPEYSDNTSWWGVLTSYVSYSSEDSETPVPRELALKGEILQALDEEKQPSDVTKIALFGLKQRYLQIVCDLEDVKELSESEAHVMLAVASYGERCKVLHEGHLGAISEGTEVNVRIKELQRDVMGVVRYKGPVPPYEGTMFGVEILDPHYRQAGTCDGIVQCKRYFRCSQRSGLFVSIDKLKLHINDNTSLDDSVCNGKKYNGANSSFKENITELKVATDLIEHEVKEYKHSNFSEEKSYPENKETNGSNDEKKDEMLESDTELELADLKTKLAERDNKLQNEVLMLEEKLKQEHLEKRKLEEEVTFLQETIKKDNLVVQNMESRLEEEQKSWKTQRKAFYREWEEFERRLLDERAERTRVEEQLGNIGRELEAEKAAKVALQEEFDSFKDSARTQERESQRQKEILEWRIREMEASPRDGHVDESPEHARNAPSDWIIARDEIHVTEKRLGVGGWGEVLEGKFRGCDVAVKQIHELILSPHNRRLFEREMTIASRCRHPCLLQFIGATNDNGTPLFVMELLDSNLRSVLESRALEETEIFAIAIDVAKALNYLHLNKPLPIIHRDISSANVLLWRRDDRWRAKVSDYGAANFMRQCKTINPGAVIYSAPEALSAQQTSKIDVFSFGLLLCEMCIRELPVPEHTQQQVAMVTNHGLRDLITRCVHRQPEERPSMDDIISDLEHLQ